MIGHLRGRLLELEPNRALIEAGGVGYDVHIPLSTYYEIQHLDPGAEVALHVHTHVREDTLALFGFRTPREKQLFERLIAISGIGPRLAQTVLSGMPGDELVAAITGSDLRRLQRIPGVGKKTAERMLIELRDKLGGLASGKTAARTLPVDDDLAQALIRLGYKPAVAENAVARVLEQHPGAPFPDLLRQSLKILSRA